MRNEGQGTNNGDFVSDKAICTGGKKNERRVRRILDKDMKKCVLGYYQLFERIIVVRLKCGSLLKYPSSLYMHRKQNIQKTFVNSVKGRYSEQNENGNSKWDPLREALVTSAVEITAKN